MFVFVVYAAEPKMAAAPKMNAAFSREREREREQYLQPLVTSRFRAESSILRRASALPWFCSSRRSLISFEYTEILKLRQTRNDRVWRHWNTIFWTGVGPRVLYLQKASWHHEHKRSQGHREYQGKHSIKSFLESFLESFFRVAFCAVKIHSTVQGCAEPSALCSHFLPCTGLEVFLRAKRHSDCIDLQSSPPTTKDASNMIPEYWISMVKLGDVAPFQTLQCCSCMH